MSGGYTQPKPGDLCVLLDNYRVQHYECDQYPNGTVADARTGEVVSSR